VASFAGEIILWAVRWYCRYGINMLIRFLYVYRYPEI
jgi:transposase-like protein